MAVSTDASDPRVDARRRRTVAWVVGLATLGMIFDGYDLVVYGAVVPTFLRDPSQIGHVSPAMAGALGSYALVGALLAGTGSDILRRRKVMLAAYAWLAIGIPVTALTSAVSMFGLLRFLTRDHIMASLSINRGIGQDWPFGRCDYCQSMRRFRRLLAHARW
jgi:MFS transporter, AAHS family, benzoate transport protein